MFDFFKKICTLEWIKYHFSSLVEILLYSFPFRKKSITSTIINPFGIIAFISVLVCFDIYYEATMQLYYNKSIIGVFDFLLAFAFTIFITFVFKRFSTFVKYDGFQLTLLQYGFYGKNETVFNSSQFLGLYELTDINRGVINYKICIAMKGGANILLNNTTKQLSSQQKLGQLLELFHLKEISHDGKTDPINNFYTGVTNTDSSSF